MIDQKHKKILVEEITTIFHSSQIIILMHIILNMEMEKSKANKIYYQCKVIHKQQLD
jgi:hypothetical protein